MKPTKHRAEPLRNTVESAQHALGVESARELSDDELLSNTHLLLGTQRRLTARFIGYLSEIEQRRLHLKAACSSLFVFCRDRLGMSEGEAFRRSVAVRLVQRFPVVMRLIESGAVYLSTLALVRKHLTEQNHVELLNAISGKGKRAVEELLARRFPKPDVPSRMRKVPVRRTEVPSKDATGADGRTMTPPMALGREVSVGGAADVPRATPCAPTPSQRVEPLCEARYKVAFTARSALKDKLERARDLLRHANPSGDLAEVVERAVDLLLADLEKKKLGKASRPRRVRAKPTSVRRTDCELHDRGKPRPVKPQSSKRQALPRATRREVFARDGVQCRFVDEHGRRCEARAFLEIDHVLSRARGGSDESVNLRVLCKAHNRLSAEQTFGRAHIDRAINLRQRKRSEDQLGFSATISARGAPI